MTINHYENFPVASWLMPAHLRPAVRTVYAFARSADDFADEGDLSDDERTRLLDAYVTQLQTIEQNKKPSVALFIDLASVIDEFQIPLQPFYDLLSAFKQDVKTKRYSDYASLLDYCSRSANPVGRIMLHLFKAVSPSTLHRSDQICTALQLTNFWQDIAIDRLKDRIYLPQADLASFGISQFELDHPCNSQNWRKLMQFEVQRARDMMLHGSSLSLDLPGRFGFELRMVVQGGLRILEKLEEVDFDVFHRRPSIKKTDAMLMFWRSLLMS